MAVAQPTHHDSGRLPHALLAISEALVSNLELGAVMETILDRTLEEAHAQQGSILLLDERRDRLEMLASRGLPAEIVQKGYIPRKGSIAEWVIENNQPLILNDHPSNPNYQALDARRRLISAMCLPLRMHGRVIGTINLNRTSEDLGMFCQSDLEVMVLLANQAAVFIENSRLHERVVRGERLAAVGQTVAGISHCIKNILTGVKGGLSIVGMAEGAGDWKLLGQGRDILQRNLDRLSTIVLDMLDYSKEREPQRSEVSIRDLFEELAASVRADAAARQIHFSVRPITDAGSVQADGQQIYRCLLNLVQNAFDVSAADGEVWIEATQERDPARLAELPGGPAAAIVLRVGDSGPGVPAENRESIFDPFFSTKGSKGTGLGLAVTRKIVEEHGGRIRIEDAPGQGAIFVITLPA